jgi:hypothetical protein
MVSQIKRALSVEDQKIIIAEVLLLNAQLM